MWSKRSRLSHKWMQQLLQMCELWRRLSSICQNMWRMDKRKRNFNHQIFKKYSLPRSQKNNRSPVSKIILCLSHIRKSRKRTATSKKWYTIKPKLQAVATQVTLHKTIAIFSVYIPPHEQLNKIELENLTKQLIKLFIFLGNFNSHNTLWGSQQTDTKGSKINQNRLQ